MLATAIFATYIVTCAPVRRHETLSLGEHPIPITTLTGEVIRQTATINVEILAKLTPNLTIDPNPISTVVNIRGLAPIIERETIQTIGCDTELNDLALSGLISKCITLGPDFGWSQAIYSHIAKSIRLESDTALLQTVKIDPNIGIDSGGWTELQYGRLSHRRFLTANLVAEYGEPGKETRVELDSFEFHVGDYQLPSNIPTTTRFTPWNSVDKSLIQRIGGLHIEREAGSTDLILPNYKLLGDNGLAFQPGIKLKGDSFGTTQYLQSALAPNGTDRLISAIPDWESFAKGAPTLLETYAPRGVDINNLNFRPPTDEDCEDEFYGPPGLLWVPTVPGYQVMMSGPRFEFKHSFYAGNGQTNSLIRVLCLNKSLKEPDANVQYLPYRNTDPILSQIATIMDKSDRRGPIDQARAWIYTDQASGTELNKRLASPIPPDYYVFALGDVGMLGGVSESMKSNAEIFIPGFLSCSAAPVQQFFYVMDVLEDKHGPAVKKWFTDGAPQLAYLIGPQGDAIDNDHTTQVLRRCLASDNKDFRVGALAFLAGPAKGSAVLKGKLGDFRECLYSGDKGEVLSALAVVKEFATEVPRECIKFLAEKHPDSQVKSAAKGVGGSLR